MKAVICIVVLAVFQATSAQYIKSCGCSPPIINPCNPCGNSIIVPSPQAVIAEPVISGYPVIQSNSVANSLADTLSLLTVSSLLSETLPLGPNVVSVPYGYGSGCGCGGYGPGCGCGGYGPGCGCGGYGPIYY